MMDAHGDVKLNAADAVRERERGVRRRPCLVGCLAVVCVLLVLLLIAVQWFRGMLYDTITPERKTAIAEAEAKVVQLPPEWHVPATQIPQEVAMFQRDFSRDVEAIRKNHEALITGLGDDYDTTHTLFGRMGYAITPLDEGQRTSYSLMIAELEPITDRATSVTALPDYNVDNVLEMPRFMELQIFAKLMRVKANVEAVDGHCIKAMDSAMLPLAIMRRLPQSQLITHLIGVAITAICSEAIGEIAETCSDVAALRHGLAIMNERRDIATVVPKDFIQYADEFAYLRSAAANGAPIDLSAQTRAQYWNQYLWVMSPAYFRWLLVHLPPGDYRIPAVRRSLDERTPKSTSRWNWERLFGDLIAEDNPSKMMPLARLASGLLGTNVVAYLMTTATPNFEETITRTEVSEALYDLARLRLAQRIVELDQGSSTTAASERIEMIKAYLKPFPSDPFSGSDFLLDEYGRFYSVGPDKHDDHNIIIYNATNGTISSGDIGYVPPRVPVEKIKVEVDNEELDKMLMEFESL